MHTFLSHQTSKEALAAVPACNRPIGVLVTGLA